MFIPVVIWFIELKSWHVGESIFQCVLVFLVVFVRIKCYVVGVVLIVIVFVGVALVGCVDVWMEIVVFFEEGSSLY